MDEPVSIVSWLALGVILGSMGLRQLVGYRSTGNKLSLRAGWIMTLIGISVLIYAVPALLTTSQDVFRITFTIGDAILVLGVTQSWIMAAETFARDRFVLRKLVTTASIAMTIFMTITTWLYRQDIAAVPYFNVADRLIVPVEQWWLVLYSLNFIPFLPLGLYFAQKYTTAKTKEARRNTLAWTLVFVFGGVWGPSAAFFDAEQRQIGYAIVFVLFALFFLITRFTNRK